MAMTQTFEPPSRHDAGGTATGSPVLGILGIFFPPLSVLALLLGGIALSKSRQGCPAGRAMAAVDVALGVVGTAVAVLTFTTAW